MIVSARRHRRIPTSRAPADMVYLINGLSYENSFLKFAALTVSQGAPGPPCLAGLARKCALDVSSRRGTPNLLHVLPCLLPAGDCGHTLWPADGHWGAVPQVCM